MNGAQEVGQWLGITIIAVMGGAIGFGLLQIVLSIRDYFRRRSFYIEAARKMGENVARNWPAPPANLTVAGRVTRERRDENGVRVIEGFELASVSPFPRGEYPRVVVASARRGGKTEALRELKRRDEERRTVYSTPPAAMLLGFSGNRNGEIAVGARLDFEREIMDGDRPSSIEPRGIFGAALEHDAERRRRFETGEGQTDWPFP